MKKTIITVLLTLMFVGFVYGGCKLTRTGLENYYISEVTEHCDDVRWEKDRLKFKAGNTSTWAEPRRETLPELIEDIKKINYFKENNDWKTQW